MLSTLKKFVSKRKKTWITNSEQLGFKKKCLELKTYKHIDKRQGNLLLTQESVEGKTIMGEFLLGFSF